MAQTMEEFYQQQSDEQDPRNYQVGGNHYLKEKIEPWDIIDAYKLNFYEGNALKYLLREKGNRIEDLQKAMHYLAKEIHNIEKETK